MQDSTTTTTTTLPNSQFVLNLGSARHSLRKLRRTISNSFRRSPRAKSEAAQFPFLDQDIESSRLPTFSHPSSIHLFSDSERPRSNLTMDGAADRLLRRNQQPERPANVSAIFVHAGAGYHSTQNEHIHLGACESAAKMAMKILKAGGTSVDAVEAAIKVLEDKEITNAGFGSNLSLEGIVECDATIVDALGRSGACGATAQIKNPINLARAILDASSRPLSLRRVPPNLLVGQGATDFAYEQGIPVLPHEMLVSKNAKDRYNRWREDLKRVEAGRMTPTSSTHSSQAEEEKDREHARVRDYQRRQEQRIALANGTWNEGQPDSPQSSPQPSRDRELGSEEQFAPPSPSYSSPVKGGFLFANSSSRGRSPNPSPAKRPRVGSHGDERRTHSLLGLNVPVSEKSTADVSVTRDEALGPTHTRLKSRDGPSSPRGESGFAQARDYFQEGVAVPAIPSAQSIEEDLITDTVGAIAIDMYGDIASGSSSGGIGMKHKGRVGPAALVGIGSAVIPRDPLDEDGVSVAAVTSGTGEHMATTMASQKCAERLYHNTRRAAGGIDIDATEEEAMESFVNIDFMGHPGVRQSNSTGAIGVMAVKKTSGGYFLHFAHNTDSFALASMSSNDSRAHCVMSRMGEQSRVVWGARKIRID